ncbi:MAG: hypothetical protein JWP85_1211 [Rhodoglobus sp.]|nr:hypothetical protein [Rhodoglobus sp.]
MNTTIRKRLTVPLAILVALAVAPALSGCAGNPIESIIEGATGGDVDLGGAGLPEGYPTEEVPLIDGEIIFGAGIGAAEGHVWNVTVKVSGADAIEQIKSQLEGAGFTANEAGIGGTTADAATALFESDKYGVLVAVTKDGDKGFVANYTVTAKS